MNWLKNVLRQWLGIKDLDKKQNDIWWSLNDGSGLKARTNAHEGVLDFLIESIARSDKYRWKWEPKTKRWLLIYPDGWLAFEHSFYDMLEFHTRYIEGNKNYAFKSKKGK